MYLEGECVPGISFSFRNYGYELPPSVIGAVGG
jgi:hypothetical protein